MHTPDSILMYPVAHIRSDFPTKFGIPKQSGLSQALEARVVFCPEYRSADAVRGLEEFSHIWLLWQFSAAVRKGETFSPTVRPPRLGGNKRVGVFASRSPFRPNHIGLSCVKLERIEYTGEGPVLIVRGADLMDGTPILDVKPYLPYADSGQSGSAAAACAGGKARTAARGFGAGPAPVVSGRPGARLRLRLRRYGSTLPRRRRRTDRAGHSERGIKRPRPARRTSPLCPAARQTKRRSPASAYGNDLRRRAQRKCGVPQIKFCEESRFGSIIGSTGLRKSGKCAAMGSLPYMIYEL